MLAKVDAANAGESPLLPSAESKKPDIKKKLDVSDSPLLKPGLERASVPRLQLQIRKSSADDQDKNELSPVIRHNDIELKDMTSNSDDDDSAAADVDDDLNEESPTLGDDDTDEDMPQDMRDLRDKLRVRHQTALGDLDASGDEYEKNDAHSDSRDSFVREYYQQKQKTRPLKKKNTEGSHKAKINYLNISNGQSLKLLIVSTLDSLDQDFLQLLRYRRIITKLLAEVKESNEEEEKAGPDLETKLVKSPDCDISDETEEAKQIDQIKDADQMLARPHFRLEYQDRERATTSERGARKNSLVRKQSDQQIDT